MSKTQTDDTKTLFLKEFEPFVSQAVTGAIMAYLRTLGPPKNDPPIVAELLSYFSKIYLNGCWHSYGTKSDPFVVSSFDKILSFNVIKGSVCLIHWIDNICCTIFRISGVFGLMVDTSNTPIDARREIIHSKISEVVKMVLSIVLTDVKCQGPCNDNYDGKDFFVLSAGQ